MAAAPANAVPATPVQVSVPATSAATIAKIDFDQQVKPIFDYYCYQCHGNGKQRGGVRLDVKASVFMHVTPGDPDRSDVYRAITRSPNASDHMPPVSEDQPSDDEIATIKQWIVEGANWPDP